MKAAWFFLPLAMLAAGALTGCSQGHADLDAWVAAQKRAAVPHLEPLQEPAHYVALHYDAAATRDPFDRDRLLRILDRASARTQGAALIAAELQRRKDPLEAYPLDTMSMVGTLDGMAKQVALVRVDNLLYQVRVGEHLGQNYGLVTGITEHEVVLREIAQDASGDWSERRAVLQLQTGGKNG